MKKTFFSRRVQYKALTIFGFIVSFSGYTQIAKTITVKPNEIKATVQPTMWGVFFEDINLGADGGIYAELVKNRSFEFNKPMMGWTVNRKKFVEGEMLVINKAN